MLNKTPLISPSILSADFANLGLEIARLEQAKADMVHLDIMDGHFTPNITFGIDVVKSLRPLTKMTFDAHLMIDSPENYIAVFAASGVDIITFHPETTNHIFKVIDLIKTAGKKVGIALLPSSSINVLEYIWLEIDLVLVMTVNPGFSGQKFIENQLPKITEIRNKIDSLGKDIILSVDGGVNEITAPKILNAGANCLVSGSYIFKHPNGYTKAIEILKNS